MSNATWDNEAQAWYFHLAEYDDSEPVVSTQLLEGLTVDRDSDGNVVGLEFLPGLTAPVSDSDTVERVAKAMTNDGSDRDLWGMCSEVAREVIRQQARAAIEAMKETK